MGMGVCGWSPSHFPDRGGGGGGGGGKLDFCRAPGHAKLVSCFILVLSFLGVGGGDIAGPPPSL